MSAKLSSVDKQLLEAVKAGDRQQVTALLKDGANPNAKKGKKSCLDLVSPHLTSLRCLLLEAGARQPSLKKELGWAASLGKPHIVRLLIDFGADLNIQTPMGTPLMIAVGEGCRESSELLIAAGCDVQASSTLETPITKAIKGGNADILKLLLEAGCPPDLRAPMQALPSLHLCLEQKRPECLELLLEFGADPDVRGTVHALVDGKVKRIPDVPPLHFAAGLGRPQEVATLLKHSADPTLKDGAGCTALDSALEREDPELIKLLKEATPELSEDPHELLLKAAETGDLERLKTALDLGADIEFRDSRAETRHYTALMLATVHGSLEVARHLLDQGADMNACDEGDEIPSYLLSNLDDARSLRDMGYSFQHTPLLLSLIHGHEKLALEYLDRGADHSLTSHLGEDAVGLAASQNMMSVLKKLQQLGAKLDKPGRDRETPLMLACESGAYEAVDWLLENKAKPDKKNRDKESALHIAARAGFPIIMSALLEAGADPNLQSNSGTPLTAAVGAVKKVPYKDGQPQYLSVSWTAEGATTYAPLEESTILNMVELLLHAGADPDKGKTQTPLGCAAQSGHCKVVETLLRHGADPNLKDVFGNRPRDTAHLFGRSEVEELLKSRTTLEPNEAVSEDTERVYPEAAFAPIPKVKRKLKSKAFQSAVQELEDICGSKAVFQEHHAECHVDTDKQDELSLPALQSQFGECGFFLAEVSGSVSTPVKLGLFPTPQWEDAVAILQTNGINCGVGSQDIIDWLNHHSARHGLKVLTVGHDFVGGEFLSQIEDVEETAAAMYDFCPDLVDQGYGELEALSESLKSDLSFFFWWD